MNVADYARYSSDNQSAASIPDQQRDNRKLCARMGIPEPSTHFADEEISGTRRDRAGYQAMLKAASRREFDVLAAWDLKRISRAEDLPQILAKFKFWGVRVITCDGFDSSVDGSHLRGWVDGMMGNSYLQDLAKSTHRGLTGRVLSGASAGGLPFGYRVTRTGSREVVPEHAETVVRIFERFTAGESPRSIAAALNRDGIETNRGGTWSPSAIYADKRRGIGILSNPAYIGKPVWNRSRWVKHPDTGRRVRQERPREEWITTDHPKMAIVSQALWDATQSRIDGKRTTRAPAPQRQGRPPKNLLSGLLRCAECSGPMVVVDARSYGCCRAKERGTCGNKLRINRNAAEDAMLQGVREQLLTDTAYNRFRQQVAAAIREACPTDSDARLRLAKAQREQQNIARAIRAGIFTSTTRDELLAVERAITSAQDEIEAYARTRPAAMIPRLRNVWDGVVANLAACSKRDPAAREALRALLGDAITVRTNENGDPVAEIAALMPQITMVAGARSEHYLPEPVLIPLKRRG